MTCSPRPRIPSILHCLTPPYWDLCRILTWPIFHAEAAGSTEAGESLLPHVCMLGHILTVPPHEAWAGSSAEAWGIGNSLVPSLCPPMLHTEAQVTEQCCASQGIPSTTCLHARTCSIPCNHVRHWLEVSPLPRCTSGISGDVSQ